MAVCQICLIIDLVPGVALHGNRRDGGLTAAQTPRLTADSITHVTVNGPRWLMISCHVRSRATEPTAGIKYRQAMDTSTTPMARHSLLEAPHLTPQTRKKSEKWNYLLPILHSFPHCDPPDLSVASQVAHKNPLNCGKLHRDHIIVPLFAASC